MSRIGNRVLAIPAGVEVLVNNFDVTVKGPKGELKNTFSPLIEVSVSPDGVKTVRKNENKHTKQLHGTTNSLLKNMIIGVSEGYTRELEINGVGYKAALAGDKINLSLGYSHPVEYSIPKGITVEIPKPTIIKLSGIDKQIIGQAAAHIREYRKPEPYKGKGVKYKEERIIRKEGKKAGK